MGFGFALPALRQSGFSPLSLFADGSQGVWFDDSDMSTMYQDSAGTTPVTAVEQFVGLQLDLSKGLALGSEIITPVANQDFSSDTGYWSKDTGVTIGGGVCTFTSALNTYALYKNSILTAGVYYEVTFTINSISAGGLKVFVYGASSSTYSTAGTYTVRLIALGTVANSFQIYAVGTTTAVIDNVSLKQVTGNPRYQSTSAYRPTLSARYNLLTKTEQFDNAAWVKVASGVSISANATTAPDGTLTADKLIGMTVVSKEMYSPVATIVSGVSYTASVAAKAAEYSWVYIACNVDATTNGTYFNLATGAIGNTVGSGSTPSITPLGDGWYRVSSVKTSTSTNGYLEIFLATANGVVAPTFVGDNTSGIYIWGADLRPTNQTVTLPTYQRVDTSSVYDTVGFPQYIKYDGISQYLSTASINFTATAQAAYFAGLRKLATATSVFTELSATVGSNNGSFAIFAGLDTTTDYAFYLRGTSGVYYAPSSYTPPITNTLSSQFNLAGASKATAIIPTVNNVTVQTGGAGTTAGTGNFGTYPLYFGARAGSGLFFSGYEYQTIIVGKTLTATEIANTEAYVNSKTKAY
jgi:hypothetical protein